MVGDPLPACENYSADPDFVPPTSNAASVLAGLRFNDPPAPEPQAELAAEPAEPAEVQPAGATGAPPAELLDDLTVLTAFSQVAPDQRMPTTSAEFQALPEMLRIQLSAVPALAPWVESFSSPSDQPARIALMLKTGDFSGATRFDLDSLEATHPATVARLRQEQLAAQAAYVDGGAIFGQPADHAAFQRQLEADRQASLAEHQQRAARVAVQRLRTGVGA